MKSKELNIKPVAFWSFKSVRMYLSITFSIAVMANALIRNTLAIAMVCMVNATALADKDTTNSTASQVNLTSTCSSSDNGGESYQGTFVWGNYEQGLLFSAIFFGGLLSTLPAGWIADRYDPKMTATVGIFVTVAGSFLSPVTAFHGGYKWLIVLRVIMGILGQSLVMPAIAAIIARWIPPIERSTVVGIYTVGNQAASIIGLPLNAALCGSSFLKGWPSIFYINGILGLISGIIWIVFASNRPETNKFISEAEKNYIIQSLSGQSLGTRKDATQKIPWCKLFSSTAMWACLLNNFAAAYAMVIINQYTPTYFKQALQLNLLAVCCNVFCVFPILFQNGFFSALPYIVQWIGKIFFVIVADVLKRKTTLSQTFICKLMNTIACIFEPAFLIACSYMNCATYGWAVAFLSLSVFSFAATVPGFQTSLLCIAPVYSGIVNSICRFAAQFAAVMAPLVVAGLTPNQTVAEWQMVFYIMAIVTLAPGVFFLFFGSADIQEWAKRQQNPMDEKQSNIKDIDDINNNGVYIDDVDTTNSVIINVKF